MRNYRNRHTGKTVMVHDKGPDLTQWREKLGWAATSAARHHKHPTPIDTPVAIIGEIRLTPKARNPTHPVPAVAPDADKLYRSIGDALEAAGILKVDARIWHWNVWTQWATPEQPAGATLTILATTNPHHAMRYAQSLLDHTHPEPETT